jgi:TPR repeat protein
MQIFEHFKQDQKRTQCRLLQPVFACSLLCSLFLLHPALVSFAQAQEKPTVLEFFNQIWPFGGTSPSPHAQLHTEDDAQQGIHSTAIDAIQNVPSPTSPASTSVAPRISPLVPSEVHQSEGRTVTGIAQQVPGGKVQETAPFKSELDAFSTGMTNYRSGDKSAALKALEFAANKGHPRALWKLGRMYADGDGVPQNDMKAFELFSRIADENADEPRMSPDSRFVSSAFVMMGQYLLNGIPNSRIKPNPKKACDLFQYAASYYGDASAQFQLGRQHLTGTGVAHDARQAARWFHLAAEKGYPPAQALLGQLLFTGNGVPKQSARGLMWLALAKNAADPIRENWIVALYDEAFTSAPDSDRQAAITYLETQKQRQK